MQSPVKKIRFQQKQGTKSFFDLVKFSDLMALQPTDHNQFENHKLSFFVIIFIIDGTGKHSINFQDYSFGKGTLFTIGRDNIHKFYQCDAEGYILVFTEDFIVQYMSEKNASRVFQLFNDLLASPKLDLNDEKFTQLKGYINAIKTEFQQIQDGFSPEVIRNILQIIFTQILRIKSQANTVFTENKYLTQFLNFQKLVEQQFHQHHDVASYADKLNITSRTLNNITNSVVQKSAKNVINDILLSHIKRLLLNSELTITQIAFQTGFSEVSYFSKFFNQHTNQTPKSFRKPK